MGGSPNAIGYLPMGAFRRFVHFKIFFRLLADAHFINPSFRISGVAKIAFHFTNKVHPIVPECCLLICLGLIVGGMVYAYKDNVRII